MQSDVPRADDGPHAGSESLVLSGAQQRKLKPKGVTVSALLAKAVGTVLEKVRVVL